MEEYHALLIKQDYVCAICGELTKLHVDHSHVTNKVRGLLCHNCNVAIGHLKDDPDIIKKAYEYINQRT